MTDYLTYLDFDLAIEALGAGPSAELVEAKGLIPTYRARVLNSPAGQASVDFTFPFNSHELENYILKMSRPRRSVRGTSTLEGEAARDFGTRLYNAIFRNDVRDALRRSLDAADAQPDHGLRIRLRLRDAPALLDLPWEYLYDPTLHRFFCHSVATPLVRYPQQPRAMAPLTVEPPLQVLVMIANPVDVPTLDVEVEWGKIDGALRSLEERGLVELTRLENATLAALQRRLRQGRYHVFHFIGHGGLNPLTGERVLYLEDEHGRARLVSGNQLGTLLADHRSLRLALLNACEGARVGETDSFAGVAQYLVLQGIPAIIAMQFEITDRAAIILAQEFYAALADGYPVEAALAEARKAIFVDGNDIEWGTPVLYSRASSGQLFFVKFINSQSSRKVGAGLDTESALVDNVPIVLSERLTHDLSRIEDLPDWMSVESEVENDNCPSDLPPWMELLSEEVEFVQHNLVEFPSELNDLVFICAKEQLGHDFLIGKYPVTNYQFRRFIEANGYIDDRWWQNSIGLRYRNDEKWHCPKYWYDHRFNHPTQPVVGISWYEADAYCAWLTAYWQGDGKLNCNQEVRLPTDDEWVFTARGGLTASMNSGEDYPWHGPFDPRRATTKESADGHTVPVNKHLMGRTKDGVWDMSGNAYEWLAAINDEAVGYLKGGSWWSDRMQASISAVGKASRWLRHNYCSVN